MGGRVRKRSEKRYKIVKYRLDCGFALKRGRFSDRLGPIAPVFRGQPSDSPEDSRHIGLEGRVGPCHRIQAATEQFRGLRALFDDGLKESSRVSEPDSFVHCAQSLLRCRLKELPLCQQQQGFDKEAVPVMQPHALLWPRRVVRSAFRSRVCA